jgi:hypothetical protein
MALLANLTPTAATNVDALNVFSATYDNYLILVQGIQSASGSNTVSMRYAVAGTVDSGTKYRTGSGATVGASTFNANVFNLNLGLGTLDSAGPGLNASIAIQNANATNSSYKTAIASSFNNPVGATTTFDYGIGYMVYNGTSAISGVSFFLSGGGNFAAQGRIRIYGYLNS